MSKYDPPADPYGNEPTHAMCAACKEIKDLGDMRLCREKTIPVDICHACIDAALARYPEEAHAEIEYIITKYGTVDPIEINSLSFV